MQHHDQKQRQDPSTFQVIEEYLQARFWISNAATKNQDQ
jgi:hypothetical protein